MKNARVWLFRVLVLVGAGVMALTWTMPWWTVTINELGRDLIQVYPYGLVLNLGEWASYAAGAQMPGWFTPLMWLYFGVAILALLAGAWIQNKNISLLGRKFDLSRWMVGLVGLTYVIAVVTAVVFISIRAGSFFNTPVQGYFSINFSEIESGGNSSLQLGYWLSWGVGLFLIVVALLRNKIVGIAKPG
jgi:hypothetical protein